jgi:hypothetical protein
MLPAILSAPLVLDMTPVAPGVEVSFTVRGLLPFENLYVSWSKQGKGDGGCPERLVGTCIGLRAPRDLEGPAAADAGGTATFTYTFSGPGQIERIWAQGFVMRLDGTVGVTAVISRPVFDSAEVRLGDVVVANEADLAALAGVRAVQGSLRIEGTSLGAVDLPELVAVGGDLMVWENDALVTLSLPALQHVAGSVSLYDDGALTSLQGLAELRTVGGDLSVNRMDGLVSLQGLESLRRVGGKLYVFHDVALASLQGLDNLELVGGAVQLWELYALTDATLPALHTAGGRLDLFENDALVSVSMPLLERLGGYEVHHCDALPDAGSFPSLSSTGDVTLQYDEALASLDGLSMLTRVELVTLKAMPALSSLQGLASLSSAGALLVSGAPVLPQIELPLQELDLLQVEGNDGLVEMGLPALFEVTGDVTVVQNPLLSQCGVEGWLGGVTVGGTVTCGENLDDGCSQYCLVDTGP